MSANQKSTFSNRTISWYNHGVGSGDIKKVIIAAIAGLTLACTPLKASTVAATPPPTTDKASDCSAIGTVWWNELLSPETDEISEFYAKVIGWSRKVVDVEEQRPPAATPDDRYTIFMAGKREIAGLMSDRHPDSVQPRLGWFIYIQVADVDAAVEAAQAEGGTVLRQPVEIAHGNRIAVVRDPMGNVFGLVTPAHKGKC